MDELKIAELKKSFPGEVHETPGGGIVVSKLEDLIDWARSNSLWPLVFGTSCCAIEMMSAASAKYDWSRFGFEVARATPRQADVIVCAGTIVYKMAPVLKRLYDQMADPKYVIAMGACTISGGPFFYNTYSVVKGIDHIVPVDVYVPGCPPRPEALIHALLELQNKIRTERPLFPKEEKRLMTNEELKQLITGQIPEAVFEETQFLNCIVEGDKLHALAKSLRENPDTDFDYLFCESGVDWKEFMYVVYHLTSKKHKHTVVVKAKIADRVDPKIESVSDLWKTAEMHELEIFDLFGIKFINHPHLRRLFMDDTWGYPLRKDYTDDINIVAL